MKALNHSKIPAWKAELNKVAYKYHVIISWVAIVFVPIFGISDYYISASHFNIFITIRLFVSVAIFATVINKNRFINNPEVLALVPFICISLMNACMYSVMSVSEIQTHSFAYITLFIGAGMFVIWSVYYSVLVVLFNYVINIVLFWFNSSLGINDILINGGLLTASVSLFSIFLIKLRTSLTTKEIIARLDLAESNSLLLEKNTIIQEKNKEINDSISYAQRIQWAVLPKAHISSVIIEDYFVLFKPKDNVSGDFVWYAQANNEKFIIAAVDCTGHGVPGAMVSIICNNALNKTVLEHKIIEPGKILDKSRELLSEAFATSDTTIQDGMDISIISVNAVKQEIKWAGANNGLVYVSKDGQINELKANKQPVGFIDNPAPFETHVLPYQKGDVYYLFTDGYADQFGGASGKKFKIKAFKELLQKIADNPMQEQREILLHEFEKWKADNEQTDDVCVIGLKL